MKGPMPDTWLKRIVVMPLAILAVLVALAGCGSGGGTAKNTAQGTTPAKYSGPRLLFFTMDG